MSIAIRRVAVQKGKKKKTNDRDIDKWGQAQTRTSETLHGILDNKWAFLKLLMKKNSRHKNMRLNNYRIYEMHK